MPLSCILIGSGLFADYYGREDLTGAVLCEVNGEICYRTGDLGFFNTINKQLEYRGHRNYQMRVSQTVKLEEIEEIEGVLMDMATDCTVVTTKFKSINYLVAYVQTTHTVQDVRQHCLAHLAFNMVPSIFMILDTLPVDQNRHVNRQNLPPPDFTFLSVLSNTDKQPRTEMEQRVHKIWYQVLSHISSIPSISTSFFSLGENPVLFIRLFHLYSTNFKHNLRIATFLKQPTIAEHARLLLENATSETTCDPSQSINIMEGE